MNTINSKDISFRSVIVPIKTKEPIMKYFNAIKDCELKSMPNIPIKDCYKKLFNDAKNFNNYAGVKFDTVNNNPVLRFIGHSKENEDFLYHQLKKVDKNTQYIRDIIDDGYEHGSIDILF